jgi:hypothetical protein
MSRRLHMESFSYLEGVSFTGLYSIVVKSDALPSPQRSLTATCLPLFRALLKYSDCHTVEL